ncbi:MAG: glycine cleavage T C-terminal barrel domain-containing protein [Pseudomonadota bacterium]
MALGYVPTEAVAGGGFSIEILGHRCNARVLSEPLFDPEGKKMRG